MSNVKRNLLQLDKVNNLTTHNDQVVGKATTVFKPFYVDRAQFGSKQFLEKIETFSKGDSLRIVVDGKEFHVGRKKKGRR